jgi:competence transcription factor ComK
MKAPSQMTPGELTAAYNDTNRQIRESAWYLTVARGDDRRIVDENRQQWIRYRTAIENEWAERND